MNIKIQKIDFEIKDFYLDAEGKHDFHLMITGKSETLEKISNLLFKKKNFNIQIEDNQFTNCMWRHLEHVKNVLKLSFTEMGG